jgi:hypothetical protein
MKTIRHLLSVAAAGALLAGLAVAAGTKPAKPVADSGPKTHLLFMGLDLDWQAGREFHRVQGIRGRSAVVSVGNREQTVAMGGANNFKMVNTLKLGKPNVRLDRVKLDRFYTADNDPQKRFMEAFALSTAAMDEGMVARQQAMAGQYFLVKRDSDAPDADPDYAAKAQAASEAAHDLKVPNILTMYTFSHTTMMPDVRPAPPKVEAPKSGSVTLGALEFKEDDVTSAKPTGAEAAKAAPAAGPAGESAAAATATTDPLAPATSAADAVAAKPGPAAKANAAVVSDGPGDWFDAFELTFEVSSEKPIADPYVVIVINYVDPTDPQKPRQWVHAQQLEPVGAKPQTIRMRQAGLPPGFVPKAPSIHLYDRGRELATTAAGGMALTRDEAMDYLLVEYLSTNKQATLAAAPIPASFPEDLAARLQAAPFPKEIFVAVNKEGLPVDLFADAGRRRRIEDPAVRATITELRFCPALEKGKPVEGVARLAFSDRAAAAAK